MYYLFENVYSDLKIIFLSRDLTACLRHPPYISSGTRIFFPGQRLFGARTVFVFRSNKYIRTIAPLFCVFRNIYIIAALMLSAARVRLTVEFT